MKQKPHSPYWNWLAGRLISRSIHFYAIMVIIGVSFLSVNRLQTRLAFIINSLDLISKSVMLYIYTHRRYYETERNERAKKKETATCELRMSQLRSKNGLIK